MGAIIRIVTLAILVFEASCISAQPSCWNSTKPGSWRFESHLPSVGFKLRNGSVSASESVAFRQNIATLAEWFHQNHPMLKNPSGYDLRSLASYVWSDYSFKLDSEYGIPADMGFMFELFDSKNGKWTVEPPQFSFEINNISGGIGGKFFTPESIVDDGSRYDVSLSAKVDSALRVLREYFYVFPLKEQPCVGVDIYETYRNEWQQMGRQVIVVFNHQRPPYWLPVTVKEVADALLTYYSLIQKKEIDRMVYEELKKEIAALSPQELASPAYSGHNSNLVLRINGNGSGLQLMRFNPAYWDRSVPSTVIQLMTFANPSHSEQEMEEQAERSYPDYPQLFVNLIDWKSVSSLIHKK